MNFIKKYSNKGFVTLVSVLAIGAVGVAISISLLLLGISNSKTSFAYEQSNQAKALANACAEEGLQQIKDSTSFIGNGNLSLGQGVCSYTIISQGGQSRIINAIGDVNTIVRKIKVVINKITPAIQIVSWQEVSDF